MESRCPLKWAHTLGCGASMHHSARREVASEVDCWDEQCVARPSAVSECSRRERRVVQRRWMERSLLRYERAGSSGASSVAAAPQPTRTLRRRHTAVHRPRRRLTTRHSSHHCAAPHDCDDTFNAAATRAHCQRLQCSAQRTMAAHCAQARELAVPTLPIVLPTSFPSRQPESTTRLNALSRSRPH